LVALTAIKLALIDTIGHPTPFLLYFGAVLVAAWYGGMPAGLVTTGLSGALGYFGFIGGATQAGWGVIATQLAVFCVEGVAIAWIAARLGTARRRAYAAAEDARESAAKLEAVLSGLDHGVTMQDASGKLVYANPAAARMIGVDAPVDLVGADPARIMVGFEMLDEDGEPLLPERLPGRAIRLGASAEEILVQWKSRGRADVRWSLVSASAVRGSDGDLEFVVNVFRDVTDRRQQDEELRVQREWFQTALRSIGDAVIATDERGNVTFLNPVAEALTGWSVKESEGKPLAEVFRIMNETTRETTESPVDRVLREGVVVGLANHTILVQKSGGEIAIDDSAAPIRGTDGVLVGVVLVFRDVSAARRIAQRAEFLARAGEELASSLDYATTLATVAKLAVPTIADWCAVDIVEDGAVRRLAVTHVDPEKVKWVLEVQERYPPDPDAPQGVPQILRTGKSEMIEVIPAELLEAGAKDEEHLRIIRELDLRSYVGVPLCRGSETFGAITLVMAESHRTYDKDDLAFAEALAERASIAVENARLYRAAEAARAEAEHANRAKDDFLAMLGHELRNPLAPILTALELMKLRGDGNVAREREIVERQVHSVVRLVDDLLDVLRITRGRIELDKAPIELADVVAKAFEMAQPLIEARRHAIETDVPRGLVVEGDAVRLGQVVANLLTNAAKYTEPGGRITVVGSRVGDRVQLRVRDTGIGIAAPMLASIFDVFVQAPQAIDRAQGGLGLGLTIVRSLVQMHGGTVTARSDGPGRGSELEITLPAAKIAPARVAEEPALARADAPTTGVTVLVVDDNADALELMCEALSLLGHRVHSALDGTRALEIAVAERPTIALLDLGLPEFDGYELARRLRAIPGLEALELVAITGYGQASDRERTRAAGFSAHLVKPVRLETVRALIDDLCT
jgi:PAS domain S-box-containing protein